MGGGFCVACWFALRFLVPAPSQIFSLLYGVITPSVIRTIAPYSVHRYGTIFDYRYTYWSLAIVDTTLQLCGDTRSASRVFKPLDVWAEDLRSSFAWLLSLSDW